jgi:cytidine deaminase
MQDLVSAAHTAIQRVYREPFHTVGAAARTSAGGIFTGVNLDCSGFGPCAESIALGAAITAGQPDIVQIVAVRPDGIILSPCGNCSQLLVDLAPNALVLMPSSEGIVSIPIAQLLPDPYRGGWNEQAPS